MHHFNWKLFRSEFRPPVGVAPVPATLLASHNILAEGRTVLYVSAHEGQFPDVNQHFTINMIQHFRRQVIRRSCFAGHQESAESARHRCGVCAVAASEKSVARVVCSISGARPHMPRPHMQGRRGLLDLYVVRGADVASCPSALGKQMMMSYHVLANSTGRAQTRHADFREFQF